MCCGGRAAGLVLRLVLRLVLMLVLWPVGGLLLLLLVSGEGKP